MTNERREWMERVAASTAICSDPTKECGGCVYDHLCGTDSEQAPDLLREAGGLIWELLGELDGMKLMGELDRRENGQLSGKTEQCEDQAGPVHGQDWEMALYERAIRTYGEGAQVTKAVEELSELSAELARYALCGGKPDDHLLAHIREELADVEIMCNQLELIFGDVSPWAMCKLERLERRLEAGV